MCSMSLSALGRQALTDFCKLVATAPGVEILPTEYQRLLLWSASLGVVGGAQSSLDYRLRNAELVREVVLDLLTELSDCITALNDIYSGTRAPYDVHTAEDIVQHPVAAVVEIVDSSSESDADSDLFGDVGSSSLDIPGEAETRLEELADIIDKLYKFAIDIRNSATRSGPGDRNPFRKFSVEKQKDIFSQLGKYEEFLIDRHIQQARELLDTTFAQAEPQELAVLKARCGRANVLRRQCFSIWQERHDQGKEAFDTSLGTFVPDGHPNAMIGDITRVLQQSVQQTSLQPSVLAPSAQRTVTTLDPAKVRPHASGSSYSRATRTAPSQGPGGERPPWPSTDELPTTEYFQCPYCFLICPERYRKSRDAWRSHIVQDLRPYLCTYPQCESGEQVYQHRSDWENHEKYVHRRIWRCPDHASEELSQEDFIDHVHTVHQQYSSQLLSDEGLRAAESTALDYERSCPFCAVTLDSCNDIDNHIAYHLECIALLTLPHKGTAEDDFASESANQVDDSRFSDSQLSFWKADDNGNVITDEDDVRIDNDLDADALALHQPQSHPSSQKADLVLTWRSVIDQEISTIQGGFAGILETAIVDRKAREDAEMKHPDTLQSMASLAATYHQQGRLREAEEMYLRALRGYEMALGLEHTSTLNTANNLGNLYADQGKTVEAEEMYVQAVRGYEKAVGLEHTSTLGTVNNLGLLYANQGKMAEAEDMYVRALLRKERALGPEHMSTLGTVNNLGNLYANQGKMEEAEDMYARALLRKERTLGPEHTSTLGTVNNIGNLYANQGKMAEAEEMYVRALRGYEEAWGPKHKSTLSTVNNLGNLYADQGKMAEAEEMYARALRGYEKMWGPEHTSTLGTVNNLGNLFANQGKMEEAEEMYVRALRGYEKVWGPEHTSTLGTVNNLGNLYADQGKMAEAEDMYVRALYGKERTLGPEHTSTLDTVNNLGNLFANQGKMEEAEEMYVRALRGYEKALGPEHTSTLSTVNNLGNLFANQGKMAEAEEMYVQALRGYEKAVGVDHPRTKKVTRNLQGLHARK